MRFGRLLGLLLLVTCAAPTTQPATKPAPPLETPTPQRPVSAAMWIETGSVYPDADIELHVLLRIAPGHWLYGRTAPTSPFTTVQLKLESNPGVHETDSINPPTPDSQGHFTGQIEFRRRLHVSANITPGKHSLSCELAYQACNPDLCWPVQSKQLKTEFEVSAHPQN